MRRACLDVIDSIRIRKVLVQRVPERTCQERSVIQNQHLDRNTKPLRFHPDNILFLWGRLPPTPRRQPLVLMFQDGVGLPRPPPPPRPPRGMVG